MLVSSIGKFMPENAYNNAFSGDKNSQELSKCRKPCAQVTQNADLNKNTKFTKNIQQILNYFV